MGMISIQQPSGALARAVGVALLLSLLLPASPAHGQCGPAEIAKLAASDPAALDRFGVSVAVSGDTAVVGVYNDSHPGASLAGSAYVFVRLGGVWVEQAKLIATDAAALDQFGISVALSGDTAVIGAWQDDDGGSSSGSAYVFVRSGPPGSEVWTEQAKLTASDAAANNLFGISVAVSDDTAVVGASFPIGLGMAYVFVRSGTVWTQQAKLTDVGEPSTNAFGHSVAVSGDTAVIGSPEKHLLGIPSSGFVFKGAAFVFVRSGGVWTQQAMLTASDATQADRLGVSVSLSGDTIVAGAWQDDHTDGLDHGSAYVFVEPPGGWTSTTETAKLTASDAAPTDHLGISVAVSGDTVLVGAYTDDLPDLADAGSAYVYVEPPGGWADRTESSKLTASDAGLNDLFGVSVALSGSTAVVGAYFEGSSSVVQTGSVYIFKVSSPSSEVVRLGSPPNPAAFLPGITGGPVVGSVWSPVVDHTSFLSGALVDVLALSVLPANVPSALGTILCDLGTPPLLFTRPAGQPFALAIPPNCSLVGVARVAQAASVDPAGIALTNALDLVIGAF